MSRLPVCGACLEKIQPFKFAVCARCGEALATGQQGVCTACQNAPPPFIAASALGGYDGSLRGLIHLLKYHGVRTAASVLGRSVARVIEMRRDAIGEKPLIVPIPLHRAKFRARNFNQAEEIARVVKRITRLEMSPYALIRRRNTDSQTGKTQHQRRENVRGAFAVRRRSRGDVSRRNIILIDDVMTTGATAAECTRVLLRAGARQVFVATAARVTSQAAMVRIEPHSKAAGAQG